MKTSNLIYQLWHVGFIILLLSGYTATLKIGKGAVLYYFFALMSFIAGLAFYYWLISTNKIFNFKMVLVIIFFEIIIFWFAIAMIHSIEWGQGTSFG